MTTKDDPPRVTEWVPCNWIPQFFGRLTLNFDSIVSADLGVMKTKENSARITDWVSSHWIPQLLSSSDS